MLGKLTRTLAIAAAAVCAVAVPAASAAAGPARSLAVKVGPKQLFVGLVNGRTREAVIRVLCPGVANTGHPLRHQSVRVDLVLPPPAASDGYTGTAATSIGAWLNWPASAPPPAPAYVATFASYRSMSIPTSITVPCSGSGEMLFLPAPGSPKVKAATVGLTFVNIGG